VLDEWEKFIARWAAGDVAAAEVRSWHETRLRQVLEHVREQSPFYRTRLAATDLTAVSASDLTALPFTTKQDLGEAMYDLICGDIADSLYFFCTTGTTGVSSPCPRSVLDVDLDNAPITASLGQVVPAFLDGAKPVIAMLCPNETHSVCLTISAAARALGYFKFDAFPISPVIGFRRVFELLQELSANVIICSPGMVMALAEMSDAYGIDVKADLGIKAILTTGELCTPHMAALIEDVWGARTINWWYGAQEVGTSALAGPDGVMVAVTPNHLLEVVDPVSGSSLGSAGVGELCLTTLIPGMKPLIRYRTGDLVELATDAAGRQIITTLGRVKDTVVLGGVARPAAEIERAILGSHRLALGYRLEISESGGRDQVLVQVKPRDGADLAQLKACVAESVSGEFDVDCQVQALPLLDMESATGGWVSWKTARIRDLRGSARPDEIEQRSAAELSAAAMKGI
jgi:phenylacetate-CoA ligase